VIAGFAIAWRRELAGGLVTVGSLALFYLWLFVRDGRWPAGGYFLLFAAPGFLHVASALLAARGERSAASAADVNFVRQQGFRDASPQACSFQYPALMWQPRAIGVLTLVGLALQAGPYFLVLSAILWWNAAVPRLNPFDWLYNHLVAKPRGRPRLTPAPAPRRFSQGMAGTFMLAIGLSLLYGWRTLAWSFEALLVLALAALIFGRFCMGSYIFLLLTGQPGFANKTLPWARAD